MFFVMHRCMLYTPPPQKASIFRLWGSACVHTLVWPLPHRPVQLGWTCQECETSTDTALGVTASHHTTSRYMHPVMDNSLLFRSLRTKVGNREKGLHITLRQTNLVLTVTMIIIIIIAFQGTIQDFWQSLHCSANCLQHIHSSGPGAIVCKSCATHWVLITCNMSCYVPCGTKGQLSYKVWQSVNCIYFSCILLAEPFTNEGGEETGVPGENPWRQASENATY